VAQNSRADLQTKRRRRRRADQRRHRGPSSGLSLALQRRHVPQTSCVRLLIAPNDRSFLCCRDP
jgi:hypothetical protein